MNKNQLINKMKKRMINIWLVIQLMNMEMFWRKENFKMIRIRMKLIWLKNKVWICEYIDIDQF